jgi:hypothetical protein
MQSGKEKGSEAGWCFILRFVALDTLQKRADFYPQATAHADHFEQPV